MAKHKKNLKPCPFCGAPAVMNFKALPSLETDVFAVSCVGCGAASEWYGSAKQARKAWNRREKGAENG